MTDNRHWGPREQVATYSFTAQTWATGDGHAAKTAELANVNGKIVAVRVVASSVTANPTVDVAITGANSAALISFSGLADGSTHYKASESNKSSPDADFNPVWVNETLTVSIDPSADAGGVAQTLTVTVTLYVI